MAAIGSLTSSDLDRVRDAVEKLESEHGDQLEIATINLTVDGRGNHAVITWMAPADEDAAVSETWSETEVAL